MWNKKSDKTTVLQSSNVGLYSVCIAANMIFLLGFNFVFFSLAFGCENGWESYQESCYIAIQKRESWFDAMNLCKALGGYLVEMQTPAENSFILNYTRRLHPNVVQTPYRYWIGAHDIAVEGQWNWAYSHEKVSYSGWAPGEPNSYGGDQDCMEIQGYQNYLWDDNSCDARLYAICEAEDNGVIVGR